MDEITLTYKVNETMDEVNILGKDFVDKNKNNCELIYAEEDEEEFHELTKSLEFKFLFFMIYYIILKVKKK